MKIKCQKCGEVFESKKLKVPRKYCGRECSNIARREDRKKHNKFKLDFTNPNNYK